MKKHTGLVLCGSMFLVSGLDPTAFGRQLQASGYSEAAMMRLSMADARSAVSSWTVAPPGASAAPSTRMLGVDVTLDNLLEISTTTGNGAVVGPVGDDVIGGLAYDPNNGILYGSSTATNTLVTIDSQTGATTVVGSLGVTLMHGLGYDSDNDVLYGITNQSSSGGQSLWRIDVGTGAATFVGAHNQFGLSGLAYDAATDTMYASEVFQKELYTIDLGTGAVTLVGNFGGGVQIGVGLEFDASLGLFATDNKQSGSADDELFRIDTGTGAATLVGRINAGNVLGLALETGAIGTKYCTANLNSTGSPADLSASGSSSSAAGDLMLTSAPVPNQSGIFFHGMNQSQNPFGNGFMCTTGNITRGAVVLGVANVASYTYDNSNAQHSLAGFVGTTRHFQHWFRDPAGGGAFFNTSNAVSIPILP